MCPEPAREVRIPGEIDPLDALFDRVLRGDSESLDVFFTLLKTRYGRIVFKRLRRHRGYAHTATLEDVMQQSLLQFMEEIRHEALPELPPGEARNILSHFQGLCDQNLQAHRKSSYSRHNVKSSELHEDIIHDCRLDSDAAFPVDEGRIQQRLSLVRRQIARLPEFDRMVFEEYVAGVSHVELAQRTGKSELALRALVCRVKQRLTAEIAQEVHAASPAGAPEGQLPRAPIASSGEDIRDAMQVLPKEVRQAVFFVHLEGGTPEALAENLGDRGLKKAQARLRRGYQLLSARLDLPFPESFSLLKDAADA